MKKKLLFVINSLGIGGSERSLVSLLNILDYSQLEVDLMMLKTGEDFEKYIPKEVNILDVPEYYLYIIGNHSLINKIEKFKFLITRYKTSLLLRLNRIRKNPVNSEQVLYFSQKNILKCINKEYDIAIAYAQGYPTYFVMDKVKAKKKIAWINCDYVTTKYDKEYDYQYYSKYDQIIAVSNTIKESIVEANSKYRDKIQVILDIVNPKIVNSLANEFIPEKIDDTLTIVTVGRLVIHHKGYDLAVSAARLLKQNNVKFKWIFVGEGPDRIKIQKLIEDNQLSNEVLLVGKQVNPYPYMKLCDIYVQPSRKEGLGLTVIEAKILKKPIVCTDFNTAKEIINSGINGLIVKQDAKELMIGINNFIEDNICKMSILTNLSKEADSSTIDEINKINRLFLND